MAAKRQGGRQQRGTSRGAGPKRRVNERQRARPSFDFRGAEQIGKFLKRGVPFSKRRVRLEIEADSMSITTAKEKIKALSEKKIVALRRYLLAVLDGRIHAEKRERGNAAALLSFIPNRTVFYAFKKILLNPEEYHPFIRANCARIGDLKTEAAGDVLVKVLKREKNPYVVEKCLIGLGRTGISKFGPALVGRLEHSNERYRVGALRGIRAMCYKPAVEAVVAVLNKKGETHRVIMHCGLTLGEIADEKTLNSDRVFSKPYKMLKSKDLETAKTGLIALWSLGSKRTLVPLLVSMSHPRLGETAEIRMWILMERKINTMPFDLGEIFRKTDIPEIEAAVLNIFTSRHSPGAVYSRVDSCLANHGLYLNPKISDYVEVAPMATRFRKDRELKKSMIEAIDQGLVELKKEK